ncbi:MAG: NAD-dependent epimerase/dehydratase family protein [Methylobacteriaceae bacterium]|nr:NAD-dependent epimerase/dehydratase family protein [Methylobacteriaceae bacterium]
MVAAHEALVTGASGFVGSAVARALIAAGGRVRALVRSSSPRTNLAGLDATLVEGDLRDSAAADRAVAGVRYLFHVAAAYRLWVRDPHAMVETNVGGTERVMRAALRAGVEKIVYTSSVATLAIDSSGVPGDETRRLTEAEAIGVYKRSKVAAERLVERLVADEGLPAVIVNPSTPIGPRDVKPTPTGRIIVEAASGRMPGYVDTGLNLVHVDDVAAGHLLALSRGRVGERYILGGEDVGLGAMLAEIARLVGRKPPRLRVPRALIYPVAMLAEAAAGVTGREPFATLDGLRMAKNKMFFTSAKARAELGYQARPFREALREAIEWFAAHGYIRVGSR